jgi:hypothetical protein
MSKVVLLLSCFLLAAGCRDACLSLADQICSCQPDETSKGNCNLQAKSAESTFAVGKADEQFCQQKLDANACNCTALNTPEGRAACGLVITSP